MKLNLYYRQLDSTQSEFARISEVLGKRHELHIRAGIQSKGRGRDGNLWSSVWGGLWFSVNLIYSKQVSSLPLYAGYIVHKNLQKLFPGLDLSIKWPNDIYLDSVKLAGIICENHPEVSNYIIGIGINTNNAIDEASHEYKAANLINHIGMEVSNSMLATLLTRELRENLELLKNPVTYLDYCNRFLFGRGMLARISQGQETTEGIIEGITPQGYLSLRDSHGESREMISGTLRLI